MNVKSTLSNYDRICSVSIINHATMKSLFEGKPKEIPSCLLNKTVSARVAYPSLTHRGMKEATLFVKSM